MSRPSVDDQLTAAIDDLRAEAGTSCRALAETLQGLMSVLVEIRKELTELNTTADGIRNNTL